MFRIFPIISIFLFVSCSTNDKAINVTSVNDKNLEKPLSEYSDEEVW